MSDLTLYKICLKKLAISLRDGIYKSCRENPFGIMPSLLVNDIASEILNQQRDLGFRADDLEQLLTSGMLQELKISVMDLQDLISLFQEAIKVLNFLKMGCQKLEILYLSLFTWCYRTWSISEVSVTWTRSDVRELPLKCEISEALANLLKNTPNLKDFHCCLSFDLKALRNCQKLRRLRLHFQPEQHWYEFLEKDNGHLQAHKFLEVFTVCRIDESKRIPYDDVVIILQHCPKLTSLGFIESSGALSQLYQMDMSLELKLRRCYWRDIEYDGVEYSSRPPDHGHHRVREAIMKCPMIEELEYDGCCLKSIPHLNNLRNLVYLNIDLDDGVSGIAFNDSLQVIGPQLKHLCFCTNRSMDISLLLQNCFNLESLRLKIGKFKEFANLSVSLPKLKYLTLDYLRKNVKRVFHLLSDCKKLTELFIFDARYFDDQTLHHFLERNSLSNLKVAYLDWCGLTEHGFRKLLLNAPHLKKVRINSTDLRKDLYERVVFETNHKASCNNGILFANDEFFQKRSNFVCL